MNIIKYMFNRCIKTGGSGGLALGSFSFKRFKFAPALLGALFVVSAASGAQAGFSPNLPSNFQAADQEKSYMLSVNYDKASYSLDEISVLNAAAPDRKSQPETGFSCDIVSMNDEILYSFKFGQPNIQCGDQFDASQKIVSGGCKEVETGTFSLIMPYFKTGKSINIYDKDGKMVFNASVADYAQLCGDNICQGNENSGTCPSDCQFGIRDSYCDRASDGVCDPDCAANLDSDCAKKGAGTFYIIAIALVLLIAVAAGYIVWKKRKSGGRQEGGEEEQN